MNFGVISPQDWGLPVSAAPAMLELSGQSIPGEALERRLHEVIYTWLPRQFSAEAGAYYGFYRPSDGYREPPQTVNLIASWLLMAAYDRYQDPTLLARARSALDFYYRSLVVSHPMSVVAGGARDGVAGHEIWTKFSAELVIGCLGLHLRSGESLWLERALQGGRYLLQAARHDFAPKFFLNTERWGTAETGWDSWGRAVEAALLLEQATRDAQWRALAIRWGEHALSIQAPDGGFYLINREYYNTDLAADELRALAFLSEITGGSRYLQAARRFAGWLRTRQRPDGAWSMTIDREGNVVVPSVGPGDVPNIAIALLRLHSLTQEPAYLESARRAFGYSLSQQVLPGSPQPYSGDENMQWGFYSWDPPYDFTVSADQATHHARGLMFLLDYMEFLGRG